MAISKGREAIAPAAIGFAWRYPGASKDIAPAVIGFTSKIFAGSKSKRIGGDRVREGRYSHASETGALAEIGYARGS